MLKGLLEGGRFRPDNIILEHIPAHFPSSLEIPAFLKQHGYGLFDIHGNTVDLETTPFSPLAEDNLWARRHNAAAP